MGNLKLIKFYADWCGPCKVMDGRLENFDVCEVLKCNIDDDDNYDLASKYGVRSIPTLILVNEEEKELKRWIGVTDIDVIKKEVEAKK